jgi:hypothetical protein
MPGMYDLYQRLFDTLRTLSDEEMLLMNFSFVGPLGCQYGSWGALVSQFAPTQDAPKYQALMHAIAVYEGCQPSVGVAEPAVRQVRLSPNPTTGNVVLENIPDSARVRVYTSDGRLVAERFLNGAALDLSGMPPGLYTVHVTDGTAVWTGRVVVR